jgi:HAD superfamily hydrolase (TIGR01509 family)
MTVTASAACGACRLGRAFVVFDAAGTLFSQRDLAGHMVTVATEAGYSFTRAHMASVLARMETLPVWPKDSRSHAERLRRWQEFFQHGFMLAGLSDAAARDTCAAAGAEYVSDAASYELLPDVTATLSALAGHGHRLAIASNFDGLLSDILSRLGLDCYFESVVKSVDLGVYKPDPEFYAALLRSIGVPASQVLFVGDAPRSDVLGPQAAGMAALLVDRAGRYGELGLPSVAALTDLIGPAPRLAGPAGSIPC